MACEILLRPFNYVNECFGDLERKCWYRKPGRPVLAPSCRRHLGSLEFSAWDQADWDFEHFLTSSPPFVINSFDDIPSAKIFQLTHLRLKEDIAGNLWKLEKLMIFLQLILAFYFQSYTLPYDNIVFSLYLIVWNCLWIMSLM